MDVAVAISASLPELNHPNDLSHIVISIKFEWQDIAIIRPDDTNYAPDFEPLLYIIITSRLGLRPVYALIRTLPSSSHSAALFPIPLPFLQFLFDSINNCRGNLFSLKLTCERIYKNSYELLDAYITLSGLSGSAHSLLP